ncbi:MAG: hypothetical protein KGY50_05165 [Candidatus Thermoplasmatota archaeon]|nr:hypothetical protein [Candidatus Thermoplasmatota archaeon]
MKKQWKGLILSLFLLSFVIFSSFPIAADSNAGVGVINVPPNYADIKFLQQDNTIRVYLTLSDYNSWSDISKVELRLEENGVVLHKFIFKQWESDDSFNLVNEFIDESSNSLLQKTACDVSHSERSETVADRCQLHIRFVFKTTYFSQIHIISNDRAGDSTETFIEYQGSDMNRDSNTLLIPWIDGTMKAELPPFMLDISILLIAVVATVLIGKKTPLATTLQQVFYETK